MRAEDNGQIKEYDSGKKLCMVTASYFNSKMERQNCQTSSTLNFMWTSYYVGELFRTNVMKIFIGKIEGCHITMRNLLLILIMWDCFSQLSGSNCFDKPCAFSFLFVSILHLENISGFDSNINKRVCKETYISQNKCNGK